MSEHVNEFTQKEEYSIWVAENLGEKTSTWYAPYLERLGVLFAKFDLYVGYNGNFFAYKNYEEFKDIYQRIIKQSDEEIAEILKGSKVRYPKSYAAQKITWRQGLRSSSDKCGTIVDFGIVLRSYLKFLYYRDRPGLVYPDKESKRATYEGEFDDSINYWVISTRDNKLWDDQISAGFVALKDKFLGDFRQYESREAIECVLSEKRDDGVKGKRQNIYSKAVWEFCKEIQFGDVIYAKIGSKKIVGRGIVVGDYEYDEMKAEYQHIRKVAWTEIGEWELREPITPKVLTCITPTRHHTYPEWLSYVDKLISGEGINLIELTVKENERYGAKDFLSEVFIEEKELNRLVAVLENKKNLILKGAPGVGKTFIADRLAYAMMEEKDDSRILMIQFHQSYSYEDFIEGYRPKAEGDGFELKQGPFVKFARLAAGDPERDYFFIIDEVNRGNISKIFGELMVLIETDKRGKQVNLLYSNEKFSVPENLYIIGMMNTADRSLALLDYALRRRFAFIEIEPAFENPTFKKYVEKVAHPETLLRVIEEIKRLNVSIEAELGIGFRIGHSYFIGDAFSVNANARVVEVVEYEIIPQLYEYWFDDEQKAAGWADSLRECCYGN